MIDFLTLEMNFTRNVMVKANNIKKLLFTIRHTLISTF